MEKQHSDIIKYNWWNRRSKLEKKLLVSLIVSLVVSSVTVFYVSFRNVGSKKACDSPSCLLSASQIVSHIDPRIDPCEDFFQFACGKFIEQTHGDLKASSVKQLENKVERQLTEIIKEPPLDEDSPFIKTQKRIFKLCMNETDEEGTAALEIFNRTLEEVGGWPVVLGHEWNEQFFDWIEMVATFRQEGYPYRMILDVETTRDPLEKNRNILYVLFVLHFGRAFNFLQILDQRALLTRVKEKLEESYKSYMAAVAVAFGADENRAAAEMEKVFDFMERLSNVSEKNNYENEYNGTTRFNRTEFFLAHRLKIEDFQRAYPDIDWLRFINKIIHPVTRLSAEDHVVFPYDDFAEALAALINKTPKRILANYIIWFVIDNVINFFPQEIQKLEDNYKCLSDGYASTTNRFRFCKSIISRSFLPSPAYITYARKYLPEEKKDRVQSLLKSVKEQFVDVLEKNSWMDEGTRVRALEKAESIVEIVGTPGDYFSDAIFEKFTPIKNMDEDLEDKTFFEILLRHTKQLLEMNFADLIKSVKDSNYEFFYKVITKVNAMYSIEDNALVLPVGILQGLFYEEERPMYLNYGSLGSIIGHELTHAFCETASEYDKDGNPEEMWSEATKKNFEEVTRCMVEEAESFDVEDTEDTINGTQTLEENIADYTGLKVSYQAYKKWVQQNGEEPQLTGIDYTPYQLFWISAISYECYKLTGKSLEQSLKYDDHALSAFRATGPIRNNPDFAKDFACPTNSKMNPAKKCQVF